MNSLLDIVGLILDLLNNFSQKGGFRYWLIAAGAVVPLVFFGAAQACRLWNRSYKPTPFLISSIAIASLFSGLSILVWPATEFIDEVVELNVLAWAQHLETHTVKTDPEWERRWKDFGYPGGGEGTTPWFGALAYNTRKMLEDKNDERFYQPPISSSANGMNIVVFSNPDTYTHEVDFEFSEGLGEFRRAHPFIGNRLPLQRFEIGRDQYERLLESYSRSKEQQRSPEGTISYSTIARLLSVQILSFLIPEHTERLATSIRIALVVLAFLCIALPLLASGIASYTQIQTDLSKSNSRVGGGGGVPKASPNSYRQRLRGRR
jgi:hypothetical protein